MGLNLGVANAVSPPGTTADLTVILRLISGIGIIGLISSTFWGVLHFTDY